MKKICENTADWSGKTKHTRDRQRETVREKVVVSGAPRMQSHEGRPRRSTFSSTVLPTKLLEIAFCTNKVFWFCSSSLDSDIWHGGGWECSGPHVCIHEWHPCWNWIKKPGERESRGFRGSARAWLRHHVTHAGSRCLFSNYFWIDSAGLYVIMCGDVMTKIFL